MTKCLIIFILEEVFLKHRNLLFFLLYKNTHLYIYRDYNRNSEIRKINNQIYVYICMYILAEQIRSHYRIQNIIFISNFLLMSRNSASFYFRVREIDSHTQISNDKPLPSKYISFFKIVYCILKTKADLIPTFLILFKRQSQ